jgi:hypothetical protein
MPMTLSAIEVHVALAEGEADAAAAVTCTVLDGFAGNEPSGVLALAAHPPTASVTNNRRTLPTDLTSHLHCARSDRPLPIAGV